MSSSIHDEAGGSAATVGGSFRVQPMPYRKRSRRLTPELTFALLLVVAIVMAIVGVIVSLR